MDYTIDHVRACEPATNEKQAPLPKKIWTAWETNLALNPLNVETLTVTKMTQSDKSDRITTWEQTISTQTKLH